MPLFSLGYRRPAYVQNNSFRDSQSSFEDVEKTSVKSGSSGTPSGIPSALTFDKIISGGTCPPCTLRDFMNYLIYVERAAENLQFFLWHRDYVKRFKEAKTSDLALAPEWTQAMEEETIARIQKDANEKLRRQPQGAAAEIFKGTDFEKKDIMTTPVVEKTDPFSTPPHTPGDHQSQHTGSNVMSYKSQASDAFATAGVKQPFTIQPFREEINRVIATYIMDNSPRQLNLSDREQKVVVQALAYTTHPSAFRLVARSIESSLRRQAHPNFIRWSICNGNPSRVWFARGLGVTLIVAGVALAIVLTLSKLGRGWRALAAIAWVLGIATLMAAYKGMCVVLHGMHHRHVRPWELFMTEDDEQLCVGDEASLRKSYETFGSSNSYEDEPWVIRYQKRNVVRKIFDRELWIQEPALRQIQDTIFVQSMLSALLLAGVLSAVFVAVPGGNFF